MLESVYGPLPESTRAFIRAWKADTLGNIQFRLTQRNFNPIMALAANITIVEVENDIVAAGRAGPGPNPHPGRLRGPNRADSSRRHLGIGSEDS